MRKAVTAFRGAFLQQARKYLNEINYLVTPDHGEQCTMIVTTPTNTEYKIVVYNVFLSSDSPMCINNTNCTVACARAVTSKIANAIL